MKSQRVTKLLACVLSSAMCLTPVPVFASGASQGTVDKEGTGVIEDTTITTDFGIAGQTIKVTVPTSAGVRVNPTFKQGNLSVNGYRIASKDILIQNKTLDDDKNAVPVLVTAKAKVTPKDENVKVYYDPSKFTPSSSSNAKEVCMQLAAANSNAGDISKNNAQYTKGTTLVGDATHSTVTTLGSLIQFQVPAATSVNASGTVDVPGYMSFAVIGDANENAPWKAEDLKSDITYSIRATSATSTVVTPVITLNPSTAASGNALSINIADTTLAGGKVGDFVIRDTKGDFPEWTLGDTELSWARNANKDGWVVTIKKGALDGYIEELGTSNDKLMLLISYSDGRVLKQYIPLA